MQHGRDFFQKKMAYAWWLGCLVFLPFIVLAETRSTLTRIEIPPSIQNSNKEIIESRGNYIGQQLSLNFQNISVRAVLQVIAEFSGQNIVVNGSVQGNITLRLNKLPWDEVLDIILETQALGKRKVGNALIIAPAAELAAKEKEQLLTKQQASDVTPLRSILISSNYSKAVDLASLLRGQNNLGAGIASASSTTGQNNSILSARGSVNVDLRTNTLWVQDVPSKLVEIRDFIRRLDVPVKQVLIEARIVEMDKTYERDLGIRFGITKPNHLPGPSTDSSQAANIPPPGVMPTRVNLLSHLNVDLPAVGVGIVGGASSIGLALAKLGDNVLLDLELSALESENIAKIIASPRLITANQKEATIQTGEEIPYQQATSSGATSVEFKKAVLSLDVTPQITPDSHILMDLTVTQDKRGPEVLQGVPSIDTRTITTEVLVDNGQTVVLGGIYQQVDKSSVVRVPFLGNLPVVGFLFRKKTKNIAQTELLIFITPKIITQPISISKN